MRHSAAQRWRGRCQLARSKREKIVRLEIRIRRGSALDARVTAINEGLNDPSQRFRTELVVNLAYGELSRLPSLAADLVNDRVRAIVAVGPPAVQAAKNATADIPVIAIDLESDPVASGWIESLARPRNNVTGVFLDFPDFAAKCLQLLKEAVPSSRELASYGTRPRAHCSSLAVQAAARGMRIDIRVFEARRAADIADAFHALDLAHIQGVLVLSSPLFGGNPQLVAGIAVRKKCPPFRSYRISPERAGCSLTGLTFKSSIGRREVWCVKCCRALFEAEMPAERPTRFELIANLKSAKALGLEIPPSILARADEVIE